MIGKKKQAGRHAVAGGPALPGAEPVSNAPRRSVPVVTGKRKKVIEDLNKGMLGAIGLFLIGALLVGTLVLSGMDLGQTMYKANFLQAAQIEPGNQVTIAGIRVGAVKKVRLARDHVVVDFTVDKGVKLGADTRAAIKVTTILGSRYLQVNPVGTGEIPDRTIPLEHTQVPFDLERTLEGATSTLGDIDAQRIADSVRVLSSSLHGVPEQLPQTLNNLDSLSGIIKTRRQQLGGLLDNTDQLSQLLRRQKADVGALVIQGNQLLGEIAARRDGLKRLLDGVTELVGHAKTILNDEPQMDALIDNLHDLTKLLSDHDALIRNILQTMPIGLRNLANATGSGNSVDLTAPAGLLANSWMCALSSRAPQFHLVEYFKDCQ